MCFDQHNNSIKSNRAESKDDQAEDDSSDSYTDIFGDDCRSMTSSIASNDREENIKLQTLVKLLNRVWNVLKCEL